MEKGLDTNVFSLMQTGSPYKSFLKTILGKLYVSVWNSFTNTPEGRIIVGNPKEKNKEACIIDVWSQIEEVYFKKANKKHFETGNLIEYVRPIESQEKSPNDFTDAELLNLLNNKFFTLQNKVEKMTAIAPLFRLLTLAREMEKSEKIIRFLESKISELQLKDYMVE